MIKKYMLIVILLSVSLSSAQDMKIAIKQLENRNPGEAKSILEKVVAADQKNAEAHYYLGKALMQLKDAENASEQYEKAVELNPNNSDYHLALGQAYGMDAQNSSIFTKMRLAPKVKGEFIKAVELNPKSIQARNGLIQFYLAAPGIMGGSNDKALNEAKAIVGIDEFQGHIALATVYARTDNFSAAADEFRFLESKNGIMKEIPTFLNQYGYLLIKLSRFDEAIVKFKKQAELIPTDPNSYDSLGDGYKAAGKKTEAIAAYKKALQLNPNFEPSKKNLDELTR